MVLRWGGRDVEEVMAQRGIGVQPRNDPMLDDQVQADREAAVVENASVAALDRSQRRHLHHPGLLRDNNRGENSHLLI